MILIANASIVRIKLLLITMKERGQTEDASVRSPNVSRIIVSVFRRKSSALINVIAVIVEIGSDRSYCYQYKTIYINKHYV